MTGKFAKWNAQSLGDKIFDIMNFIILALVTTICVYPLYYILVVSFSSTPYGSWLIPNGFSLEGYKLILGDNEIWRSYLNTIYYAFGGVVFSLCLTVPCAYALSRKDLPGKKIFTGYLLVTMFINGGMIPTYLVVQRLHLLDTWIIIIIMTGVSTYNIIVARTFFATTIPDELLEASRIDGCGNGTFMVKVVLPLSKPILAVLALWIGVARWNSYYSELIYLRDKHKYPLSMYLRKVLWQIESLMELMEGSGKDGAGVVITQGMIEQARLASIMQYVVIVVSMVPVLIIYPFIQKYFAQGVMIGSVKG